MATATALIAFLSLLLNSPLSTLRRSYGSPKYRNSDKQSQLKNNRVGAYAVMSLLLDTYESTFIQLEHSNAYREAAVTPILPKIPFITVIKVTESLSKAESWSVTFPLLIF